MHNVAQGIAYKILYIEFVAYVAEQTWCRIYDLCCVKGIVYTILSYRLITYTTFKEPA